jgi:predicted AlkP superfamily phosphohydrolase/phosphomutase
MKTRIIILLAIMMFFTIVMNAAADTGPKVLVLGFDGMDPKLLETFRAQGVMPNFEKFLSDGGHLAPFGTSTPPQSPVAWSNFTTGMDSGGHGIFDFIHRDPDTLLPFYSASEAKGPMRFWKIGSWKFPRGGSEIRNLRQGVAFWELLSDADVNATIFKVPANFPPVECEARSLSGMGTPDITGNYGISTLITDNPPVERDLAGGRVVSVYLTNGRCTADLLGPANTWREGDPEATAPLEISVDEGNGSAWIKAGDSEIVLNEGEWSHWVPVTFEMFPLLKSVHGICRFYLMETSPHLRLYVTPVQIDPVKPEMPISTPPGYSREIAEETGLFYTQGLPDDTSALENAFFGDEGYVQQSDFVLQERLDQLEAELDRFAALEEGFLFFYFNSPDQVCHMMWRNMDHDSPTYAASDHRHEHRIRDVYAELDAALGVAVEKVGDDAVIMVMSDHGFAPWNRAFNVNTWLYDNGYLVLEDGVLPRDVDMLFGVDWRRTKAYAIGINGLYINLGARGSRHRPARRRAGATAGRAEEQAGAGDRSAGRTAGHQDGRPVGPGLSWGHDQHRARHRGGLLRGLARQQRVGPGEGSRGAVRGQHAQVERRPLHRRVGGAGDPDGQPARAAGKSRPAGHGPDHPASVRYRTAAGNGGRRPVQRGSTID